MQPNSIDYASEIERIGSRMMWLPGVLAAVGFGLGLLMEFDDRIGAGVWAFIFWFGTVITLLYKSADHCGESVAVVASLESQDNAHDELESLKVVRSRALDLHQELLHPGLWIWYGASQLFVFLLILLAAASTWNGITFLIR